MDLAKKSSAKLGTYYRHILFIIYVSVFSYDSVMFLYNTE